MFTGTRLEVSVVITSAIIATPPLGMGAVGGVEEPRGTKTTMIIGETREVTVSKIDTMVNIFIYSYIVHYH